MSSVLSCIVRHHLAVKTCADTLKSLSTAAELAGMQFNFIHIEVDGVIMVIQ